MSRQLFHQRPFVRLLAILATAIALWPSRAAAQATTPADTTMRSLTAVVVSATRASTTLERVPLHATVVSRAEILKSPAQTLDQLLRDIPGMNLPGAPYYTTDPTGQQTKMRGVTNSKVLMLVDGVPVHDPFYSTTQWFKIPLSSIERVEVLRGGSSSLWGNLAVAGVVNIVTRKPIDETAQADISSNIATALKLYELDNGKYPSSEDGGLNGLFNKPASATNWNRPYLEKKPVDPWGREYVYKSPGQHRTYDYDLYSLGHDGQDGTPDDVKNWD